jgi:hypothetical protein
MAQSPEQAFQQRPEKMRQLVEELPDDILDGHQRARFAAFANGLDRLARTDRNGTDIWIDRSSAKEVLKELVPDHNEALMATLSGPLGAKLRDEPGEPLGWGDFIERATPIAHRDEAASFLQLNISTASTPETLRQQLANLSPEVASDEADRKMIAYLEELRIPESGVSQRGVNVEGVDSCIMQSVEETWWAVAIFCAAAMIITLPFWWIGLAVSGVVIAGWLLTIILNCIFSN